jgi:hypothetical protein
MFTSTSTRHAIDLIVRSSSPFWRPLRLLRPRRQTSVVVSKTKTEPKPTAEFRFIEFLARIHRLQLWRCPNRIDGSSQQEGSGGADWQLLAKFFEDK